jgi:hypothetical protein
MSSDQATAGLRRTMLLLTGTCPKGRHTPDCPFQMLGGLSYGGRKEVLARMERDELLYLFDLSPNCSCPADPRRALAPDSAPPAA